MAKKYYGLTPYGYCNLNPVRFQDPDGADGKDKVIGFVIGVATNVVPGTSRLRDSYSPNDASDYNNGLQSADVACLAAGATLSTGGAVATAVGEAEAATGAVAAVSVVGAPEGAVVVAAGAATATAGEIAVGAGAYMMAQSAINSSDGYNRGKISGKNERHGDGGRSLSKSEKQIDNLTSKLAGANRKDREEIKRKIQNIKTNGESRKKGEEHSRGNKR